MSNLERWRLAADIEEQGLEFEVRPTLGDEWRCADFPIQWYVERIWQFRLKPLTLLQDPHGRPLHNPDGLTAEQVGRGFRLFLREELDGRHTGKCELWLPYSCKWARGSGRYPGKIYRVPASTPWPDPPAVDRWAELRAKKEACPEMMIEGRCFLNGIWSPWTTLTDINWSDSSLEFREQVWWRERKAFAEGKKIECRVRSNSTWKLTPDPRWYDYCEYRVAPCVVPLGPEDVPPGSVVRFKKRDSPSKLSLWIMVTEVTQISLSIRHYSCLWDMAQQELEIKRPGEEWKACEKEEKEK
jgi:hypothetical protein